MVRDKNKTKEDAIRRLWFRNANFFILLHFGDGHRLRFDFLGGGLGVETTMTVAVADVFWNAKDERDLTKFFLFVTEGVGFLERLASEIAAFDGIGEAFIDF